MSIWYAHDDRNSVTRVAERAIWASQLLSKADCALAKHETAAIQAIWAIWALQLLSKADCVLGQSIKLGKTGQSIKLGER